MIIIIICSNNSSTLLKSSIKYIVHEHIHTHNSRGLSQSATTEDISIYFYKWNRCESFVHFVTNILATLQSNLCHISDMLITVAGPCLILPQFRQILACQTGCHICLYILFLIWQPFLLQAGKAMKYVWSKICDIFARLILCGHNSSTLMAVARKRAGGRSNSWKPLWERNFWPALGNHVPGTWHQTKLQPNLTSTTRVQDNFLKI